MMMTAVPLAHYTNQLPRLTFKVLLVLNRVSISVQQVQLSLLVRCLVHYTGLIEVNLCILSDALYVW